MQASAASMISCGIQLSLIGPFDVEIPKVDRNQLGTSGELTAWSTEHNQSFQIQPPTRSITDRLFSTWRRFAHEYVTMPKDVNSVRLSCSNLYIMPQHAHAVVGTSLEDSATVGANFTTNSQRSLTESPPHLLCEQQPAQVHDASSRMQGYTTRMPQEVMHTTLARHVDNSVGLSNVAYSMCVS